MTNFKIIFTFVRSEFLSNSLNTHMCVCVRRHCWWRIVCRSRLRNENNRIRYACKCWPKRWVEPKNINHPENSVWEWKREYRTRVEPTNPCVSTHDSENSEKKKRIIVKRASSTQSENVKRDRINVFPRKMIILWERATGSNTHADVERHTRAQRPLKMNIFSADKCQSCLHIIFANVLRQPTANSHCQSDGVFLLVRFCFSNYHRRLLNDVCGTKQTWERRTHKVGRTNGSLKFEANDGLGESKQVVSKLWIECEWDVEMLSEEFVF